MLQAISQEQTCGQVLLDKLVAYNGKLTHDYNLTIKSNRKKKCQTITIKQKKKK